MEFKVYEGVFSQLSSKLVCDDYVMFKSESLLFVCSYPTYEIHVRNASLCNVRMYKIINVASIRTFTTAKYDITFEI